jgi:flagellar M-ring protein FliF
MGDFADIVNAFPNSTNAGLLPESDEDGDVLRNILAKKTKNPTKMLEQLVDYDEGQAAAILKQWIRQGEKA